MSIPEYLVSRSSLRANRPDALIGSEIVMVTKADYVAAVAAVPWTPQQAAAFHNDARQQAIDDCAAAIRKWGGYHTAEEFAQMVERLKEES